MTLKDLTKIVLEIRDNHLDHMKKDIDKIEQKVDKMDARLWWVLAILVGATVLPIIKELIS